MKEVPYIIMRHAAYHDAKHQFITYHGMSQLSKSVEQLLKDISETYPQYKKMVIAHSEVNRAMYTAWLIKEMLLTKKIIPILDIELVADAHLNCNKHSITIQYVQQLVSGCEAKNALCLMISHEPDIESYLKQTLFNSEYLIETISIEE